MLKRVYKSMNILHNQPSKHLAGEATRDKGGKRDNKEILLCEDLTTYVLCFFCFGVF